MEEERNGSGFMSLGKEDLLKSVSTAFFGILLTTALPVAESVLASLKAGALPVLPAMIDVSSSLLKAAGTGLEVAGVYLTHKFFSEADGSPLGGILGKYLPKQQ
jgi:hypothetical protein